MATATDVSFPSSTGRLMRAALAVPPASTPRPAVIVIHEIFGLNADIRRIAGRFADLGYVGLAVDLYDTGGPKALCVLRTLLAMRQGNGRAFDDLEAARRWLAARAEVDPARTGVVGFCMGGGFALLYATRAPLKVAGTFYGDVPKTADGLRGICPVLGGFGGRDRIFAPQGERLPKLLDALGVPHDVKTYPAAGHSYMSHHDGIMATIGAWGPMSPGFDPEAEADSWRRIEAFYRQHLS
ncbi:MAG: dienelactone hydrolase family protein [Candidatus Binatia bacterium]